MWKVSMDGSREGHPAFGQHLTEQASGFIGLRELPQKPGTFISTYSAQTCFGGGPLAIITPNTAFNFDLDEPNFITSWCVRCALFN